MANNEPVSTIKGKYAGKCPNCNINRGDWELKGCECKKCGYCYEDDPKVLNSTSEGGKIRKNNENNQ